mmetsp:Transcript_38308/g.61495  ORF Transcript_38308/g.61495 Transcript_38308/m.61495 type:complete len:495 (-) Transcript_38308:68-1552(-)
MNRVVLITAAIAAFLVFSANLITWEFPNNRIYTSNGEAALMPVHQEADETIRIDVHQEVARPTTTTKVRFAIVTPTYQGHFEQNVRFLLTLLKNCIDCEDLLIQFVLSYKEDSPALFKLLTTHPGLRRNVDVTLHSSFGATPERYTPSTSAATRQEGENDNAITKMLHISVLPLRTAYEYMQVPVNGTLLRTWRNKKWFGKYTHLSIKKYAGAYFAFGKQGIDVVWWLDSEAYLWKSDWNLVEMLAKEWQRPRLYWSAESHYKRNSEVHQLCPRNGTLPAHLAFEGKRPHLFSSSFYLVGKRIFNQWTEYVEQTWKRRFADIFIALGQRESGYILHIIETQLIAYVGGCQNLNPVPESCKKYELIEVNSAIRMLMRPEKEYFAYLKEMKYQGQFEHMFRLFLDERFQESIKRLVRFFDLPSFRIDHQYGGCELYKAVLGSIISGEFMATGMAMQTNSDESVARLVRDPLCFSQLPIVCGTGVWNETCHLKMRAR